MRNSSKVLAWDRLGTGGWQDGTLGSDTQGFQEAFLLCFPFRSCSMAVFSLFQHDLPLLTSSYISSVSVLCSLTLLPIPVLPSPAVGTNKCRVNNGGCSSLCLATPGSRQCACAEDQVLDTDGVTCLGMKGLAGGKDGKVAPAGECHAEGMTRGALWSQEVSGGQRRAERKREMGFRETLGLEADWKWRLERV